MILYVDIVTFAHILSVVLFFHYIGCHHFCLKWFGRLLVWVQRVEMKRSGRQGGGTDGGSVGEQGGVQQENQ